MNNTNKERVRYFTELAERLYRAAHGDRAPLVSAAASALGCSKSSVYSGLKDVGWQSGRKRRADYGRSKVTEEEAKLVGGMVYESRRTNGKEMLPFQTALEVGQASGQIRADVSLSTIGRAMRRFDVHPDQLSKPEPHVKLRSLHPNHVWEFDVSVCVLYYLDNDGLAVMDEKRFYKNKPQNVKRVENQRVLRYLVTDHRSGAFYLRYYLASGETQEVLFNFLVEAFTGQDDPHNPFRGVPFFLLWDAGSANQAYLVRNFLDRMEVKHQAHTPGQPRAKGQVETMHNVIERNFESRLFMMKVRDINHLNAKADQWSVYFNSTKKHSRHGHSRFGLWQTIQPDQLRLCPSRELCELLLSTAPEERTVNGNLAVRYAVKGYGSAEYSVRHVPDVRVGDKVMVCVNPYRAPNLYLLCDDENGNPIRYQCEPVALDGAGFPVDAPVIGEEYKAQPATPADVQRRKIAKEAYGADTNAEVDKARQAKQPAYIDKVEPFADVDNQPRLSYMQRSGTELNLPGTFQIELQPLSHVEACKRLVDLVGRALNPVENRDIRALFPNGVPEDRLAALAEQLRRRLPLGDADHQPVAVGG